MKYIFLLSILGIGFMSYVSKNHDFNLDGNDEILFERFEKQFPVGKLPYAITVPSASYNAFKTMGYEAKQYIPEMEFSRFSRMTRSNGTYNAKLFATDKYTLLAYSMEESVSDTLAPVVTTLATFDKKGKRIDKIEFACQCTPDNFKTGAIDQNLNIVVKKFKNVWMYDPAKKGYLGNEVKSQDLVDTELYSINDEGHFHKKELFVKPVHTRF